MNGVDFAIAIPLSAGLNTIVAKATGTHGEKALTSVGVNANVPPNGSLGLIVTPHTGAATLPATFSFVNLRGLNGEAIEGVQMDFDGDGTMDASYSSLSGFQHDYPNEGLYIPRAVVTTTVGSTFATETVVNIIGSAQFGQIWAPFTDLLRSGDVDSALDFVTVLSRSRYRDALQALQSAGGLGGLFSGSLQLNYINDDRAAFTMFRSEADGTHAFQILFVRDDDGVWRLHSF